MSAPATPSRKGGDVFRIASAGEALGGFLAFSDSLEEGAWPKASPDDQPTNPVLDVEQAINKADFGRVFQEYRGVKPCFLKHSTPSITLTRRDEGATPKVSGTLTPVPNRRTGLNAVRFQKVSLRHIFRQPDADNDNFDPLEAA